MTATPLTLDQFLTKRSTDRRLARLTHDIALPIAHGLEFGALDNPISLSSGMTVEYVDYARDASTQGDGRVTVDHVWTGAGSLRAVVGDAVDYDFAIASQVAQYVPNLLGWFEGIFEVLRPGGVLNLSLPDRRFMFDRKRNTSSLGQLVEAYYLDLARPSPRQIFEHTFEAVAIETAQIWRGDIPATIPRFSGEYALDLAHKHVKDTVGSDRYVTCHCWVFTPLSFLDLLEEASKMGLFRFVISQFASTDPGGCEFFVCLRRDAEESDVALKARQLFAIDHVRAIAERQYRTALRLAER